MAPKSLFFLVAIAACVDAPETDVDTDLAFAFNDDGCPKLGCSSNSPFLGPTEFHELHERGTYLNDQDLYISAFRYGTSTTVYRANVTGTTLAAEQYISWLGGWYPTRTGQDLVGMNFIISGPTGPMYEMRITKVSNTQQYWQAPFTTLETYELKWKYYNRAMHYINVCTNPPSGKDPEAQYWGNVTEAILFTGDRYDTDRLTVTATDPASAGNWFNVGCFGNVMAKLVLNRHTHASQLTGSPTTWAQRQTMLKMYTSDVCGGGRAFTVQGTPIQWFAANGWSSPGIMPDEEGLWNEFGAVCMNTHRLTNTPDDATAEIAAECAARNHPLPTCTNFNIAMGGPYIHSKTAVPLPP